MAAAFRWVDLLPSQMLVKFCRNHDRFSIPLRCKEMAAARRVQTTRRFTAGIEKTAFLQFPSTREMNRARVQLWQAMREPPILLIFITPIFSEILPVNVVNIL